MYDADVDANRVVVAQTGSPNLDASNKTGVRGVRSSKLKARSRRDGRLVK